MTNDENLKHLSKVIVYKCVRNTVLEDYHAKDKLNQTEVMALMKEASNKVYTFLRYLNEEGVDHDTFMHLAEQGLPKDWDEPELDKSFVNSVAVMKTTSVEELDELMAAKRT